MDRERRIPADLAESVEKAGVYQLFLPARMGGPQLDPMTAYRVIEEVSRVEASVGWCGLLSNGGAVFAGNFTPKAAETMFGCPPDFRCAGSFRALGESRPVPGGYRVSGRWDYASGISNANWLFVNSRVVDEAGPRLNEAGRPDTVMLFTPIETAAVYDTWQVVGLCGTGSNDFELDGIFVPAERSFRLYDPPLERGFLYSPRTMLIAIWVLVSAVALGTARGAMDAFKELATGSGTTISTTLLRDRPQVQSKVGEAEAIISGARAHVLDTVGRAWESYTEDMPLPSPDLTQARLAITRSIHEAARAVDILFHAAGTNAIHRRNGLERRWRDVHVVVQHGAGLLSNYEFGGQALMGLRPSDAGW
ncbi:Flavin-dependent monooxygenase, oxygenase subunit HsaA [Geodia barretti]|uniref:Flavin-dependent monooxygenase, oxygenase subunit HsaA n=1 Tax=Geodia barretti TaxID=519541 RepID=A0AA35RWS0_GEOBA|nr:Flavin-dependent monooxygenase, oxygenase subunit HsaA [Geodia barretti]